MTGTFEELLRGAGWLQPRTTLAVLERLHKAETELRELKAELGRARTSRHILAEELRYARRLVDRALDAHRLPGIKRPPIVRAKP